MKAVRLRYICAIKDRYGKNRYYFRIPNKPYIRLPDIDAPEFPSAYAAAREKIRQGPQTYKPNTLIWLIEAWMRGSVFRALSPSTQTTYTRILVRMQREDYALFLVRDFRRVHIKHFIERLADRPAAANHRLKLFRMLFDYAIEEELIEENPARFVKRHKERAEGAEPWREEDISQFEAYWPSGSLPRRALALLLYTGQRRSDVVRLGPSLCTDGLIRVKQQKTGAEILIPIHDSLADELAQAPAGPFWLMRKDGCAFTPNGFYMRFRGWCEQAGLRKGLSPHGLRKAAARRLAEAGCSLHQIASITGHKTIAEVQRYTRSADQKRLAREAIKKLGNVKQQDEL